MILQFQRMYSAYFSDFFFIKHATTMLFASAYGVRLFPRSFLNCIKRVFLFCSNPKMFWINTRRIVPPRTVVKNAFSFWNRASIKNPRRNMRRHWIIPSISSGNIAVTKGHFCCFPNPTPSALFHFRPKSFWEIGTQILRSKVLRGNLDHIQLVRAARVTGPAALLFCHIMFGFQE